MPNMNMIQSLNSALDIMLETDSDVIIFGEDVGYFGGVFRTTDGLQEKHSHRAGRERDQHGLYWTRRVEPEQRV